MQIIRTSTDIFLETVAKFEGRKLDYDEYFFWRVFWELEYLFSKEGRIGINRYFIGSRQISKSTSLAGDMATGAHEPYHRMIYVAPQSSQTKAFSNMRLSDILETPVINRNLFSKQSKLLPADSKDVKFKLKNDVFTKRFITGSYINLTFTDGTDSQRLRGLSGDSAFVDEAQSMTSLSGVHHVLVYCLRSSPKPRIVNVGTTLGEDEFTNVAENDSMFFLYHVVCDGCNLDQDLRSLDNIDLVRKKVICRSCGKPLDVSGKGRYIPMNPKARLFGMHANMLMLPSLKDPDSGTWHIIRDVVEDKNKTEGEKKEELLGVPSSMGESLINRDMMNKCPRLKTPIENLRDILRAYPEEHNGIIAGIDWGGDSDPTQRALPEEFLNSHTAIVFHGISMSPDNTRVVMKHLWEHTFPFEDPNISLNTIKEMLGIAMPQLLGVAADFGGGFFPNPNLTDYLSRVSPSMHFLKVQLLPQLTDAIAVAEHSNTVKVHKANLVTEYLRKIARNEIHFPNAQDMGSEQFYIGALSQRLHIDKSGRRLWKKRGKVSDDAFMASLFAYVMGLVLYDRLHELKKNKG